MIKQKNQLLDLFWKWRQVKGDLTYYMSDIFFSDLIYFTYVSCSKHNLTFLMQNLVKMDISQWVPNFSQKHP